MIAFLDTEFTGLDREAQLLSIGIVIDTGWPSEFYAEVTDPPRIRAATEFARAVVLPQFGKVAGASCTYAELGHQLMEYLDGLLVTLRSCEVLKIAFESDRDWVLLARAAQDASAAGWAGIVARLHPENVYNMAGFAAGILAANQYFSAQRTAALSRHHALCDAHALKVAYEAATMASARKRTKPVSQTISGRLQLNSMSQPS